MTPFTKSSPAKITVYIGSDHAGFQMKQALIQDQDLNRFLHFIDLGTDSETSVDYPDYGAKIASSLQKDPQAYAIGICGTGIGICIVLNKFPGVYAANLVRTNEASYAKEHNNVNTLALSGRFVDFATNKKIIEIFFAHAFDTSNNRHIDRLKKIKAIEDQNKDA